MLAFDQRPCLPTIDDPRAGGRAHRTGQAKSVWLKLEMELGEPRCLLGIAARFQHDIAAPAGLSLAAGQRHGWHGASECGLDVAWRIHD